MDASRGQRSKTGKIVIHDKETISYNSSSKIEDDASSDDVNETHRKNSVLGVQSLLSFLILFCAWLVGFSSRLFAVVRFESIIHEFDPW